MRVTELHNFCPRINVETWNHSAYVSSLLLQLGMENIIILSVPLLFIVHIVLPPSSPAQPGFQLLVQMGWHTQSQNSTKSKLYPVLFTSLSWLLSWLFECLLCLACKAGLPKSLLVQSCSLHHGISRCWLDRSGRWLAQLPAQRSQKVPELLVSSIRMLQILAGVLCR